MIPQYLQNLADELKGFESQLQERIENKFPNKLLKKPNEFMKRKLVEIICNKEYELRGYLNKAEDERLKWIKIRDSITSNLDSTNYAIDNIKQLEEGIKFIKEKLK